MIKKLIFFFLLSSSVASFANEVHKGPLITINNLLYLGCNAEIVPTCALPPYSEYENFIRYGEMIKYLHQLQYRDTKGELFLWTDTYYVNNEPNKHSIIIDYSDLEGTDWQFVEPQEIDGSYYVMNGPSCSGKVFIDELNKYLKGSPLRIAIDVTLDEEMQGNEMAIITKCTISAPPVYHPI